MAKVILTVPAVAAIVVTVVDAKEKLANLIEILKNAYTVVNRRLRPGQQPAVTEDSGSPPSAPQPNLPPVQTINAVTEAMGNLSSAVDTYRSKVSGLGTPSAMRQMASAAKRLERAAKKHQAVDTLARSIGELKTQMRELASTVG